MSQNVKEKFYLISRLSRFLDYQRGRQFRRKHSLENKHQLQKNQKECDSGKSIEGDEGGGCSCRSLCRSWQRKRPVPRRASLGFLNLHLPLGGKFLLEQDLFSSVVIAIIELPLTVWIMRQYFLLATLSVQKSECDCFIKSF